MTAELLRIELNVLANRLSAVTTPASRHRYRRDWHTALQGSGDEAPITPLDYGFNGSLGRYGEVYMLVRYRRRCLEEALRWKADAARRRML
jgi:hypothetical protein